MRNGKAIVFLLMALFGAECCVSGEEPAPANYALITDIHMNEKGGMPPLDQIVSRARFCGAKWIGILGDTVNRPQDLRSNWGILSAYLNRTWGGPVFCIPGNHDIDSTSSLTSFREAIGNDYFTVKDGDCAFVFIDTQLLIAKRPDRPMDYLFSESERQDHWIWLESELARAASEHRRIFLFGHHPLYVNAENEADDYWNFPRPDRAKILDLCRRFGVQAYFAGHLHRTLDRPGQTPQIYISGSANYSFDARGTGFRLLQITRTGFHTFWVRTDIPDTDRPTTPTLLTVERPPRQGVLVSWQPSADANGIAFYRVFVDGRLTVERNIGEECMLSGLPVSAPCQVSVHAVDPFGNISGPVSATIDPLLSAAASGWPGYE